MSEPSPKSVEKASQIGITIRPWYCSRILHDDAVLLHHLESNAILEVRERDVDATLDFAAELISYYNKSKHGTPEHASAVG